jgi:hypothetical protein
MGLERACEAQINGRRVSGVAHLEPTELRFSATPPLRIPLGPGVSATTKGGRLDVAWSGGSASFELGRDAEKWALTIRYPRGRLDKLGVKAESVVSVVGLKDPELDAELRARTPHVSTGRVRKSADLVIAAAGTLADLDRLSAYRQTMAEHGAIWVVWTKGQKALTETHVRAAAKAQGLVDVKVMSFSNELSALKLVIPVALRAKSEGRSRKSDVKRAR